jgi:cob(I)alamin adenosyltransferase
LNKGLVIVFTGNGKGKSSAALGIVLRAFGHNMSVAMIQFIKSTLSTGEAKAVERLGPQIRFLALGRGFVADAGNKISFSEHQRAAEEALALARKHMFSGPLDILILDEIANAVKLGLVNIQEVLDLIRSKPPDLHLILTGRDAHPDLIAAADLVTEMRAIKHPFDTGIQSQKGIDY